MTTKTYPKSRIERITKEIDVLVRARYPLMYLITPEEERIEKNLYKLSRQQGKDLYIWSATRGLRHYEEMYGIKEVIDQHPRFSDPLEVLEQLIKTDQEGLYVLRDFHSFLEDFTVIRKVRDLISEIKASHKNVFITSPILKLPTELEKEVTIIDIPLPDTHEIYETLCSIVASVKKENGALVNLTQQDAIALAKAAQGLTLFEAENVFSKSIVVDSVLDKRDVDLIQREKEQIVRKNGILEYYRTDCSIHDLGGFLPLKKWLAQRGKALFSEDAKKYGLPAPKGMLLLGIPGTGKSLTAKVVSGLWKIPLLRLDFGKIFSGLVGSSEENMRAALKMAEALSPVVLWIDEIEKGLAGDKGGKSDGGTAARVFGTFLTWMQEKESTVFVIATANNIESLPPELLRKGRFDEIFFIDLPNEREREDIIKIHLNKRKRDPTQFDLPILVQKSKGFSGAEIEQGIVEGLFHAFYEQRELSTNDLISSFEVTVPQSVTYQEVIRYLREWASTRARKAT